jgi:hypothetical protein
MVEWAERKPNWLSGRIEFEILGKMRLRINFSRIFAKKGRRLIGRKEDTVSGGFLGLGIIIIVENFHNIGK